MSLGKRRNCIQVRALLNKMHQTKIYMHGVHQTKCRHHPVTRAPNPVVKKISKISKTAGLYF